MATVAWLHISDWHEGRKDFDRDTVREAMVRDISKRQALHPRLETIDFIVFSGDIANTGSVDQYTSTQNGFLADVIRAAGLEETYKGRVFTCPGNHDLDRDALRESKNKYDGLHKNLVHGTKSDRQRYINAALTTDLDRAILLDPFRHYKRFASEYAANDAPGVGEAAYYVVHHLSVGSDQPTGKPVNVAVACMNSAWLCARIQDPRNDKEYLDYGHIVVGAPQISAVRKNLVKSQVEGVDLKIAVLHHPVAWLDEIDGESMEETFSGEFDFLLTGHQHSPKATIVESTAGGCVMIPAGACYDKRLPTNPRSISSYNFVRVDTRRRTGEVYFRRWSEVPAPGRYVNDDSMWYRGVFPFNLPNEKIYGDALRRKALQSIVATHQSALEKRLYESVEVNLSQTCINIEGVPLVEMVIEGRIIVQDGEPEDMPVTISGNVRVKRILEENGIVAPYINIEYMRLITPTPLGEKLRVFPVGNNASVTVKVGRDRAVIEYKYVILEMLDGVHIVNMGRAASHMKLTIHKAEQLDYEEGPVGGLSAPGHQSEAGVREWFDWVAPGQGYLIQWYPREHGVQKV
jgi:predicted phosphodiesterase